MTATDELRELLDERGVEWRYHGEKRRTWFDVNEIAWFAMETPAGYLIINSSPLTPEQAIAATLGDADLAAENTRLKQELETVGTAAYLYGRGDLKAENAKLRELLRQAIYARDDADWASIVSTAIALGIEVRP